MKQISTLLLFLFLFISAQSQTILLEETVDYDESESSGPNMKNFSYSFIEFGSMISTNEDSAKIIYPGSFYLYSGYRYKRKLMEILSVGVDLKYGFRSFQLSQDDSKILPDTILHKKEKLNFYLIESSVYTRINYTKRGNYIGYFVDFGAGGNWSAAMRQFTKDKTEDIVSKTRRRGYEYYQPLNYYAFARLGFNRVVLTGSYRLSDMFQEKYSYPELARLNIGVEIGLFNQ